MKEEYLVSVIDWVLIMEETYTPFLMLILSIFKNITEFQPPNLLETFSHNIYHNNSKR